MATFSWHAYPSSDAEFEKLMTAIDTALAAQGFVPHQRPLHVGRLLSEALGWSGRMTPPDELADSLGYQGDILMAKAHRWYVDTLGARLNTYLELGYVPAKLAQTIWRVRIANWFGSVQFFIDRDLLNRGSNHGDQENLPSKNVLTLVENLPQGQANRLSEKDLSHHFNYHMFCVENIQWLDNLPNTKLFRTSKGDYASSTQELISHRYSQSRWATQQSVEKLLKGFLEIAGTTYPKNGKDGHNLKKLSKILYEEHGISIPSQLVDTAHCSTGTRYLDEPSTENQAFLANVSALEIFDVLRQSLSAEKILRAYR